MQIDQRKLPGLLTGTAVSGLCNANKTDVEDTLMFNGTTMSDVQMIQSTELTPDTTTMFLSTATASMEATTEKPYVSIKIRDCSFGFSRIITANFIFTRPQQVLDAILAT